MTSKRQTKASTYGSSDCSFLLSCTTVAATALGGGGNSIEASVACMACSMAEDGSDLTPEPSDLLQEKFR